MEINGTKVTQEYIDAVTLLADSKENRRFLNDSSDHAKLLADLMIGRASENDTVLIYSGALGSGCFADAIRDSKGDIKILLDDESGIDVINGFPSEVKNRISFKIIKNPTSNHFFVSNSSFRFEKDHGDATAIANFNEPEVVAKLTDLFNEMWKLADGV